MLNVYQQISHNKWKSVGIIFFFMLFITLMSYVMSQALGYGLSGVGLAFILAGVTSLISYYSSDSIVLALSGARPANKEMDFDFFTVAENLCIATSMPIPKLYVIQDTALNAFATGRDPQHAVICATSGLLHSLTRTELEGVISHELSHVRNYDIRLMSLVSILVGFVALLADFFLRFAFSGRRKSGSDSGQLQTFFIIAGFVLALLSPLIAQLIQLAVSRQREYLADASAVAITKYPQGLIDALQKLDADKEPLEAANKATAHLYICNPLKNVKGVAGLFGQLFLTHPPIEKRIAALRGEQV